jgi:hypothetical protein
MKSDRIKTSIGYATKEEQLNNLLNVYGSNISWYHEQCSLRANTDDIKLKEHYFKRMLEAELNYKDAKARMMELL